MRRLPTVLSLLLAISAALPAAALVSSPAAAAEPAQTVWLEYTYVPPGVEILPSGEVGTNDVRWGSCGWGLDVGHGQRSR